MISSLLLAGILTLTGCGPGGKTAAVVNGQVITVGQVEQRMAGLGPPARAAVGNDRRRLLEEMVTETILIQEARRRGLEWDPEVRRLLSEAGKQILLGRLLELVRKQAPGEVADEEIARYFGAHKAELAQPDTFRASHILVETEEAAKKTLARLEGGEPFAKVAEEVSVDPSKSRGGDIGFFTRQEVIPEVVAACEKLEPGKFSPVVKSSLGYHVILLTERHPAREGSLEESRDQIRKLLAAQQKQRKVEQFVQELRSKAQVLK